MTDNLAPDMQTMKPSSGGSFGAHVWGFFAGILSSLAFVQIFGGGWFGLLLAYCCLLPLYFTGLGGGRGPAITATVFGVIGVLLQTITMAGGVLAAVYALMLAVPAMIACRVALIPVAQNRDGFISSGAILFTYLCLGALLLLATGGTLAAFGMNLNELASEVAKNYGDVMKQFNPDIPPEQLELTTAALARSLAGLTALSWMVIHALNFTVAQWVVSEMRIAKRPAPNVADMELPGYLVFVVVGGIIAGNMLDTNLGVVMGAIASLFGVGFALVGLAVIHAFIVDYARKKNWARWMRNSALLFYYVVILGLQLPLVLALLLGLSDPWLKLRRKFLSTPTIH